MKRFKCESTDGSCAVERDACKKLQVLKREIEIADFLKEIDNNILKCEV